MKGLVFNGPKDVRYESYPDPKLKTPNSVILKVNKCSICGSDLHIYHGDQISTVDYSAGTEAFCVGHEFTGEVVEVGANVRGLKVGDKVLAAGGTGCGECPACIVGNDMECKQATAFGLSNQLNGGQAEFVNVPNADRTLLLIPDGVSEEQAMLLTDAMATASYGINNADIVQGGTVAVVGLGPIGLIGVELALLKGAAKVYAIDPVEARRNHAAGLGATVMAPGFETLMTIHEETGGGVNSVFEASGAKSAVDLALNLVGRQGTISMIGLPQKDVSLPLMSILYKNVTVRAGVAPVPLLWDGVIPLLQQGRLKAAGLFSHTMNLSDGAEAYRLFDAREDGVVKIMMNVD
ncbi:MAG: alcohol dehydrogenase catalytic domain-containing protein [Parvibaculaceae bacterium]|nr:alcohol dehydrogenase catalytic domain-containing protein [Parvibaculaceae bacterium]